MLVVEVKNGGSDLIGSRAAGEPTFGRVARAFDVAFVARLILRCWSRGVWAGQSVAGEVWRDIMLSLETRKRKNGAARLVLRDGEKV